MNFSRLELVLDELIELLDSTGESNWSEALKAFRHQCDAVETPHDRQALMSGILRIYGGMGSFSDLILYDDRTLLVKESERLDHLRRKLFTIARDLR